MSTDTLHLPDGLAALRALVQQQHAALLAQQRLLDEKTRVLDATSVAYVALQAERDRLREEFELLRRWAYGRRRERFLEAEGQRSLFDEPETAETFPTPEAPETAVEPGVATGSRRQRASRRLNLEHLPQRRIEHDVPESDKVCSCGRAKVQIGTDESAVLNYRPAVLEVEVHVLPKYACSCCKDGVVSPPVPPRPLERALPGPGLLSQIIVSKFSDHLPLYRQEDIFTRHGLHISRSTLCDWVRGAAELLAPLAALQQQRVLQSPVLWTDDTTVRLLDRESTGGSRQARFWTYIGDDEHPYAVYDFTPSRARAGPAEFLKDYQGYLHADAYSAYDGIYLNSDGRIIEVACGAHIRRKFVDAQSAAPADSAQMVERFRQLYDIEDRARDLTVTDYCGDSFFCVVMRAFLEAAPDDCDIVLDVSDLVHGGYLEEKNTSSLYQFLADTMLRRIEIDYQLYGFVFEDDPNVDRRLRDRVSNLSEDLFIRHVVVPLLEKMGFDRVRKVEFHGRNEFGSDILPFRYTNPVGNLEYYAVQAKAVAIHGTSARTGNAGEIISQATAAFKVAFVDDLDNERKHIDRFIVVTNKDIKPDARHVIEEAVTGDRSLLFLDLDRVVALVKQHRLAQYLLFTPLE